MDNPVSLPSFRADPELTNSLRTFSRSSQNRLHQISATLASHPFVASTVPPTPNPPARLTDLSNRQPTRSVRRALENRARLLHLSAYIKDQLRNKRTAAHVLESIRTLLATGFVIRLQATQCARSRDILRGLRNRTPRQKTTRTQPTAGDSFAGCVFRSVLHQSAQIAGKRF